MAEFKKKLEKPRHTYVDATEASHIYLLPNSLTAGNLFFGFLAILRCIQANYATDPEVISNNYKQAVWFIFLELFVMRWMVALLDSADVNPSLVRSSTPLLILSHSV